MSKSRIPRKILDCANYIDSTDDYLQEEVEPLNGIRLGITSEDVGDWHTWRLGNDKLIVARSSKLTSVGE